MTRSQRRLFDDGFDVLGRIANETVEGAGRAARRLGLEVASGPPEPSQRDVFDTALAVLGLTSDWLIDQTGSVIEGLVSSDQADGDGPVVLRARVAPGVREARIRVRVANLGASADDEARFVCSDLFGPGDERIPAPPLEPVRLRPLGDMDAVLTIPFGERKPSGSYVGVIRAVEADAWAVVEVVVSDVVSPRRSDLKEHAAEEIVATVSGEAREIVKDRLPGMLERDDLRRAGLVELLQEYPMRPGKALRPALCLAAGRAYGLESEALREVMTSLELVHNAFLIHDDIEDQSRVRRGAPTLYDEHGPAAAVAVGDLLCAIAAERIGVAAGEAPAVATQLFGEFTNLLLRSSAGQAGELARMASREFVVSEEQYLQLVRDKTAWYTIISPIRMGALVGSGGRAALDDLTRYGMFLGAAFQVHDDLENLLGGADYGKDRGADVLEGKPTLALAHLFDAVDATTAERLRTLIGRAREAAAGASDEERTAVVLESMHQHGIIQSVVRHIDDYATKAVEMLDVAFADAPQKADLRFFEALPLVIIARAQRLAG